MSDKQLLELREQIDTVDRQLQDLIDTRARLAQEVGAVKHAAGNGQFWRPDREAEVLQAVRERNAGKTMRPDTMALIFREIMSACLALERPVRVAYLGPAGTFSQVAARKHFGASLHEDSCSSIPEVFRQVQSNAADFGVVPVENSIEGSVNRTLDLLLEFPLRICGELNLRIHHHVMGLGKDMAGARRLYVHYQTRAQCRLWIADHALDLDVIEVASNGEAARRASEDQAAIAIASQQAAEAHGLQLIASSVEDDPLNTTRFLVIGDLDTRPTGMDKTSLVVAGEHRPGGLHALLAPLAEADVNLMRIESRPARQGLWQYVFFLDFEGHVQDPEIASALAKLAEQASFYKHLGSYPKAVG